MFSTASGRDSRRIGLGWNHSPCIRGPEAAMEPCRVVTREVERGNHLAGRPNRIACQPGGPGVVTQLIFTCPPSMP
jgi:hypothetical protein